MNRQYIGARYVPKFFEGTNGTDWESGVAYEPLTIVTYLGNSYTSKIPVPASIGSPNNNPTYWASTGIYSAQVEEYRQEVQELKAEVEKIPTNRKFVLVGDSFGCGIRGGGATWVTGWIDYMNQILPGQCYYYDPGHDPSFEGTAGFLSTLPFINLLEYIYNNKLGDTKGEEITDVVIFAGNNEPASAGATAITNHISTTIKSFIDEHFPNANVRLGCVGLDARNMVYTNHAYEGYAQGARKCGWDFVPELLNLGTNGTYDSGHGHWTEEGYNFYNPFIAQAVINGRTNYSWTEIYDLTLGSNVSISAQINFGLVKQVTNKGVSFRIIDKTRYRGWILTYTGTIGGGTITAQGFTFSNKIYTAFLSGQNIERGYMLKNGTVNGCAGIALNVGTTNEIIFASFPFSAYGSGEVPTFVWEGEILNEALIL